MSEKTPEPYKILGYPVYVTDEPIVTGEEIKFKAEIPLLPVLINDYRFRSASDPMLVGDGVSRFAVCRPHGVLQQHALASIEERAAQPDYSPDSRCVLAIRL
jgi:hypothetical protein